MGFLKLNTGEGARLQNLRIHPGMEQLLVINQVFLNDARSSQDKIALILGFKFVGEFSPL